MHFCVYKKIYFASTSLHVHIIVIFVSFEGNVTVVILFIFSLNLIHAFYSYRVVNILQNYGQCHH